MVRVLAFYVDAAGTHCSMPDAHFDADSAQEVMRRIRYTGRLGEERKGAHWGEDDIRERTNMLSFPDGTTPQDKYVAFNLFYADTCRALDDMAIVRAAYNFFFSDEDYSQDIPKLMQYVKCVLGYQG